MSDEPRALARHTDPLTSKAAAASVTPKVSELQGRIIEWLDRHPIGGTTHEIAAALGLPRDSISPRMKWLVEKNFAEDSGKRSAAATGRACIVWRRVAGQRELPL